MQVVSRVLVKEREKGVSSKGELMRLFLCSCRMGNNSRVAMERAIGSLSCPYPTGVVVPSVVPSVM
jgi:hypothetical protein